MTITKLFIHLPKISVGYQTLIDLFLSFEPNLDFQLFATIFNCDLRKFRVSRLESITVIHISNKIHISDMHK